MTEQLWAVHVEWIRHRTPSPLRLMTIRCHMWAASEDTVTCANSRTLLCTASTIRWANLPCHALPCHALPCHAFPCLTLSCIAMPCLVMPCHAMPYLVMPYHAMPCHATPCLTLPYLTINPHIVSFVPVCTQFLHNYLTSILKCYLIVPFSLPTHFSSYFTSYVLVVATSTLPRDFNQLIWEVWISLHLFSF